MSTYEYRDRPLHPAATGRRRVTGAAAAVALAAALVLGLPSLHGDRASVTPQARAQAPASTASLPLPVRAELSTRLGDRAPYEVRAGAHRILSARGGAVVGSFSAAGVALRTAKGGLVRLSQPTVEVDGARAVRLATAPRARGDRAEYADGAVSEWYANGPYGLEQGFSIARGRPGAITISIAETGGRGPRLAGTTVELGDGLRYGALSALDASGRRLPSRLSVRDDRIVLAVDAARARFPVRIDPFVYEETLKYSGTPDLGEYPGGLAISANGDTAVVSASEPAPGAVYIFQHGASGLWTLQQTISPGGADGYYFGSHVALSEEGTTLLVSAATSSGIGQIWTYTLHEGSWVPDAHTVADPIHTNPSYDSQKAGYEFGNAVAVSGNGMEALVADEAQDAAVLYRRVGSEWQENQTFSNHAAFADDYGIAIALSGEGNAVLVAAPGYGPGEGEKVYSYEEEDGNWNASSFAYDAYDGQHNVAVAVSADGATALAGEYLSGTARVWTWNGSWSEQAKLTEPAGPGQEEFGSDVSLSASGSKALILAFGEGIEAYEYLRTGSTWAQQGEGISLPIESATRGIDYIPEAVLSAEGDTALMWAKFTGQPAVYTDVASATTGPVGNLATKSATLKGTVDPVGEAVSSCHFEYGTSLSYGSSVACSPSPAGSSPVAVTAALSSLTAGTAYHFRLTVTTPQGTIHTPDATFTTLAAVETATTKEPSKPATATLGAVTATASGGTGTVAVGSYGTNVGEPPLPSSTGGYFDAYRSTGSSFSQVELKACEIGTARAMWAYGKSGWEPVSPAATLEGGCLVFTATNTSTPSVAELEGFRYKLGEPAGQFGECRAAKDAVYAESACLTVHESKGHADGKGKYEWYAGSGACFAQKKGQFSGTGCDEIEVKKGKAAGKYELTNASFTGTTGHAVLEVQGAEKIECSSGTSAGDLSQPEKGTETVTLDECAQKGTACSSAGAAAGTIVTLPLEVIVLQTTESGKFELALAAAQFASFSCGSHAYTIEGAAPGPLTGAVNVMSSRTETSFTGTGEQLIDLSGSTELPAKLTMTLATTSVQPLELNTGTQP